MDGKCFGMLSDRADTGCSLTCRRQEEMVIAPSPFICSIIVPGWSLLDKMCVLVHNFNDAVIVLFFSSSLTASIIALFLADISFVREKFPVEGLQLSGLQSSMSPRSNHEAELLSTFVADKMQLEAEKPSHGAFAPPGDTTEGLVSMDVLILANSQRSAIRETDARILAQQYFLDEQCKRGGNFLL